MTLDKKQPFLMATVLGEEEAQEAELIQEKQTAESQAPADGAPPLTTMSRGGLGDDDDDDFDLSPDPELDTSFPGCLGVSPEGTCGSILCLPFYILTGFGVFILPERKHSAVLYFGKYVGSVQTPGMHCLPFCCREMRDISTATRTMNMKDIKVLDHRGNPVVISAVVTFIPTSARKARIDVQNPWPNASWQQRHFWEGGGVNGTYLELQAQAVLKQVTSQFPYEAAEGQPSLQTEVAHITKMLIQTLQHRVSVTGARILSFDLVDLSYAPEIYQAMLVRQQVRQSCCGDDDLSS
jgi:hypothetical protein